MARMTLALLALVAFAGLFSTAEARRMLTLDTKPAEPALPAVDDAALDAAVRRVLAEMGIHKQLLNNNAAAIHHPAGRQLAEEELDTQGSLANAYAARNANMAYVGLGGWTTPRTQPVYAPIPLARPGGHSYYDTVAGQDRF